MAKLKSYDPFIAHDVQNALIQILSKVKELPEGEIMAPGMDLGDSYAAIIPDGCELAYAGYYESDGTLRIAQTIVEKMPETDQAALYLHEALYKVARVIGGETNSLHTRELNAYLFAPKGDLKSIADVIPYFSWGGRSSLLSNSGYPFANKILPSVILPQSPSTFTVIMKYADRPNWTQPVAVQCWDTQGQIYIYRMEDLSGLHESRLVIPNNR